MYSTIADNVMNIVDSLGNARVTDPLTRINEDEIETSPQPQSTTQVQPPIPSQKQCRVVLLSAFVMLLVFILYGLNALSAFLLKMLDKAEIVAAVSEKIRPDCVCNCTSINT